MSLYAGPGCFSACPKKYLFSGSAESYSSGERKYEVMPAEQCSTAEGSTRRKFEYPKEEKRF
ncbi:hypothetical protein CYJ37_15335 [Bacillus sp. UMB0728]|nr:hypothetical protein B9K06_00400 [Bacillus sp. OG2]PLR72884.1 hypothetical protein CYJ37_15335 [Bacillus sp. UMB0728]